MAKKPSAWGFKRREDAETLKLVAKERRNTPRLSSGAVTPGLPPSSDTPYRRFINDSGETVPARALMAVKSTQVIDGHEYYVIEKPGTTLRQKYVVNSHLEIEDGDHGICFDRGRVRVLFDDGDSPGIDQGWGPVPGSWEAGLGYPCCLYGHGEYEAGSGATPLLLGTLGEITSLFGKAQSDIDAASGDTPTNGTVIAWYWDGTDFQATTFELTGYNILPYKIKADRLYKWVAVGGQFVAVELASRAFAGTIAGSVSTGASTTVTLSDGTSHTDMNVSGQTLQAGSVLATDDAYTGDMLICGSAEPGEGGSGSGGETEVWHATASADIAAGASGNILLPDTSHGSNGTVSATNWSDYIDVENGDKVLAWQDPTDDAYYFVRAGRRQARWFKATLDGALHPTDTTADVDGVVALDGGSTPTITNVKNPHQRRGLDGAACLFVEDWDDLDEEDNPKHILADVREEGPHLGKTDSSHVKGASGTVSIWTGTPGSESDSGANVTAYNRFATIGSDKWVWVDWNGHGWYIIAAECPLE